MLGGVTNRPNIARTAITLGVIGSLAGNVTWAWPRSPVLVGVGVFMSLVLPVAVQLWKAGAGASGWARTERAIVMSFICGGAALYTLVHSSLLLHERGLPWLIAWIPAGVMEALVVMAARASAPVTVQRAKPATKAQPRRDTAPPPKAVTAAPENETREERTKRLARERQDRRRARLKAEAAA